MNAERNSWIESPLQQLTSLIRDGTHGTHDDAAEGIPLLSAKDIRDGRLNIPDDCRLISESDYALLHKSYELQQDDVLLTIVGSIGRCCLVPKKVPRFTFQRSVAVVRASKVEPSYLYQYFQGAAFQQRLEDVTNASAQGGVYLGSLAKLHVNFPGCRAEQSKIAEVVSTVDWAIAQTEALIAKQQRIKIGLMQDLLTRGIDEHGQLRTEATHAFKDSPLGRIPVEWEVTTVDQVAAITTGDKDTQDAGASADYPFFVRSQTIERISSYSFDGEAVLTAGDGVGTGKVFHYINGRFDCHQRVYCMHSFSSGMLGYYFFCYFRQHFMERVAQFSAKGSVDSVRRHMIAKMLIPKPSPEEQAEVVRVLRKAAECIDYYGAALDKLRLLKTALMQDLLTGKVRVTPLLEPAGEATP